ncbi:MAG TPA: hypothetical protein VJ997_10185 [Longimicrobiales bacterium]|nr:hypothetical protein [Longimicrobiales bacterium]
MTRLLAALLLVTAAVPGGVHARQVSTFAPDTLLQPPGGPRIVLLGTPGEGVAALRLSVPMREGPAEAGAGQILRALALRRMETLARPVGVRVSASRTPWGMAYAVEGAAADFEYLAYLLREAVAEPTVTGPDFGEARRRLRDDAAAAEETPGELLRSRLRAAAAPGLPPIDGTLATVDLLDPGLVRSVWRRSHQASAMTLVVSAPVVPEVVLAATRGLGAPEEDARGPLDAPSPTSRPPDAETLRAYFGEAFSSMPIEDPRPQVAAILVARHLQGAAVGFEMGVQLWELPDRWVLAVTGQAYPRRSSAMRAAVSGAVPGTRDALDPAMVEQAVAQVRRDIMLRAQTAAGLVGVVGRAMEVGGDPLAAARSLESLSAVDLSGMRRYLDGLIRSGPVQAEVRP